tara:strand:+ start:3338 stop:3799 length:462 start_codon:yes stop_codon:yes gene_type:complete
MAFGDRRVESGKAGISRTLRKNTKSQLNKALAGNAVSDIEVEEFGNRTREATGAALLANQDALNQQAAGAAEGSVQAQVLTDAAQSAQKKAADAAIAATGQEQRYREGATATRTDAAKEEARGQEQINRADKDRAARLSLQVANIGAGIVGMA